MNIVNQPGSNLAGTMSFNPYQAGKYTVPTTTSDDFKAKFGSMKIGSSSSQSNFDEEDGDIHHEIESSNNTQMSGGDAFQAFLSKNEGEEEDDEWK